MDKTETEKTRSAAQREYPGATGDRKNDHRKATEKEVDERTLTLNNNRNNNSTSQGGR